MGLRLARQTTKRLDIGTDGDWLEVREDISRREFNLLLRALPTDGLTEDTVNFEVASSFAEALFEAFVTGWSLMDDNGNPVIPTVEMYNMLTRESSQEIDQALSEHFNDISPTQQEVTKSEDAIQE